MTAIVRLPHGPCDGVWMGRYFPTIPPQAKNKSDQSQTDLIGEWNEVRDQQIEHGQHGKEKEQGRKA